MIRQNSKLILVYIAICGLGCNLISLGEECNPNTGFEADVTIPFVCDAHRRQELVCGLVPESFLLKHLTFESDVYMQPAEFFYLFGLKEGHMVDVAVLEKAVDYIRRKNKFESLQIKVWPEENGYHVHCMLTGVWTFHKLKIKGVLVGRDTYRRYYLMESGDPFDKQRHYDSMVKIADALKQEGYFNAQIEDTLSYDKQTKAVSSSLLITRGNRFVIGTVDLQLKAFAAMKEDQLDFVRMNLKKQFLRPLSRKNYSRSALNQETRAIKKYLTHQGFLQVTIILDEVIDHQKEAVNLTFSITLQYKREFIFFGNHFFPASRLLDSVMVFEQSVWLLPLSILTEEIIKTYHDKGFWVVGIELREENDRVFFIINEGSRAVIKEVILEGNVHVDRQRLVKTCFTSLVRSSYYDVAVLKQALSNLIAFYLKEGFWDIKIVQKRFESIDTEKHQYRLIVSIDEGQCRYLTDISIPQFPELIQKGPFKQFKYKNKKTPFDMSMLYTQKKWLVQYCKSRGMTDVSISYDLKHDGNDISVVWNIQPSHEGIHFGKTIVLGSSTFPFECIARELSYQEGEPWDRKKLNQTLSRLKELEIFETIHAYPDREMQENNQQPVILKLHKDDPFEVRLRAGLGLEQISKPITLSGITYKFGGTFIIKNPFDCGDLFSLNGDITRSNRSIIVQYKRPWLFDMPIGTVVQGYSSKYQQPGFFFCKKGLYEVSQNGALVSFCKKYKWLEGNLTFGCEWMELNIQDEFCPVADRVAKALDFDTRLLHKNMPFLFIQPTLLVDRLDNKLNPIRGSLTLLTCKGMIPLTERFDQSGIFKILVEQSLFVPLMPLVLALRLRFGHIFYQTFSNINPIERFYLGGANSLRSYDTDVAPPLGTFCDQTGKWRWAPMGGKTMVNANIEVRFPVYGDIGAVIFQDLGALSSSGWKGLGKRGLLAGTGFGIRYNTPIGPLRFDVGWKWSVEKPFDRSYAWFLTFGNAF